jgi:hypothetical protein
MDKLHSRSAQVFKCDKCGRLMIFWARNQALPDVYKPEQPPAS